MKTASDAASPLDDYGRKQIRKLASLFRVRDLRPTAYIASEYVHTRESADLLAAALGGCVVALTC